jgi:membrane fusion protein (multidrug efflux system)
VETYRAALHLAQTNLANTRLTAPFSGYISQRNLDSGASVSAQSAGTSTTSVGILVIQDIETVKLQIEVPERDIARVTVGAPVTLTADPYRGRTFAGRVVRVVHSLDPRTRTMGVEVDVPNRDQKLKPGMFARAEVLVDTQKGALTIPVEALRVGEARPSVMVVKNGVAEPVIVELGLSDSRFIEVRRGLGEQDQVILEGKDLVKPNQKVRTAPAAVQ